MNQETQTLVTDIKAFITDAEDLLKATAAQTGDKITEVRGKIQQSVVDLKPRLAQAEAIFKEKTAVVAGTANDYVHAKPWPVIGMTAGIGLLIGLLVGRH